MKRLIMLVVAMAAVSTYAGDTFQWVTFPYTFTNNANTAVTVSSLNGTVERVQVDISASNTNNIVLATSGKVAETILSASAIAADATYRPTKPQHDENGSVTSTNTAPLLFGEHLVCTVTNVGDTANTVKVHVLLRQSMR